MKITVVKDYNDMSRAAAQQIIQQIKRKPETILGLATGFTPVGMYKKLIEAYNADEVDFSRVTSFNLDEYIGLPEDSDKSYRYFMDNVFFNHINIKRENINIPDGNAENPIEECSRYTGKLINEGPVDIQILGIGVNGHIGFNEPSKSLMLETHIVDLKEETRKRNSRFFESIDEVPRKAITMGIGDIMRAERIILLASGKEKAPIIKHMIEEGVSTSVPASVLKLHKNVEIIIDAEAASMIGREENIA